MQYLAVRVWLMVPLAWAAVTYAQQTRDTRADSLVRMLSAATDYNERIRLLGELSDHHSYADSAKAMDYALRIKKLAEKQRDQRGIGIAHFRIGGIHFDRYQIDAAISHYEQAERFLEKDTTFLGQQYLARAWYNHGAQYQRKGDEETFLDIILNRSIPVYERIGDTLGMGRCYHNIGLIFQNSGEFEPAIRYHRKAIDALRKYPHIPELVDSYSKFAEAMMYVSDRGGDHRDEVETALKQADSLLRLHPDNYSHIMYLNALGMFEELFNENLDQALAIYLRGNTLADQNRMYSLSMTLLNRAYYIYDKQGRHQLALGIGKRILADYGAYLLPRGRSVQLRNLMNSYEKLGNIAEAYRVQKQYVALNDSLHDAEMAFKVHKLEQKYEAKEQEAQIMRLNQQMQAQELRAQRNRLVTLLLAGAVVLVIGISLAGYNIFRKKQLIARQQAELLEQNMEKMKQEQHISVFAAVLEGQEQERKRLAIDLHDGLGGSLSSIKMKLSKVVQTGNGSLANSELPTVVHQLDASVDELRRIARNMMPETLLKFGLAAALRDFCKGLESETVKISFQAYGLRNDIPQNIQIMVYRMVQELVANAMKHAQATHILAQCLQHGNQLSIAVEDDGKGFDSTNQAEPGMGLANVRTRVAYLGGKMDIQSDTDVGTTTTIELTYATDKQESH